MVRHKKDLLNEFRNGLNWDAAYLEEADRKFTHMLDRIGFGLVRFEDLNEEAQGILAIKVDCYEETLGQLIASRSGGGLLAYDNIKSVENEGEALEERCSYAKFLQIIKFRNIQSQIKYEAWFDENFENLKDYLLPEVPSAFYNKDWIDIWKEADELIVHHMPEPMDERDYCSLDEFIEVLAQRSINSQRDYMEWFDENLWGAVMSLDMPEAPGHIYGLTWKEILKLSKKIESEQVESFEDEYPEDIVAKLDIFESLLTPRELDLKQVIHRGRFLKFLKKAEFLTFESYCDFLDIIKGDGLAAHLPTNPIEDYDDWNGWPSCDV